MTEPSLPPDPLRLEAAQLAFALLRLQEPAAHLIPANPGEPVVGRDQYVFVPSWRPVARRDVVSFLASLPSPAILSPTVDRGVVALLLLHELAGERRKWADKTLSNHAAGLDQMCRQLALSDGSRFLLEFDSESHIFSIEAVRCWTQWYAVQVAWNIRPLTDHARADAQLCLRCSDGNWVPPMPHHGAPPKP